MFFPAAAEFGTENEGMKPVGAATLGFGRFALSEFALSEFAAIQVVSIIGMDEPQIPPNLLFWNCLSWHCLFWRDWAEDRGDNPVQPPDIVFDWGRSADGYGAGQRLDWTIAHVVVGEKGQIECLFLWWCS